jgi:hypothetical protein
MSLEDKLIEMAKANKTNRHSIYCAYQELYNSLDDKDKKSLDNAWAKNYPVNLVVKAIRADGHKTSSDAVRAHRNGTCRCPKK